MEFFSGLLNLFWGILQTLFFWIGSYLNYTIQQYGENVIFGLVYTVMPFVIIYVIITVMKMKKSIDHPAVQETKPEPQTTPSPARQKANEVSKRRGWRSPETEQPDSSCT